MGDTGAAAQWEDFWRSGLVVSCPTDSSDRYTGELKALWERFFASLPPGARVLDVGTGNGALVLIALEVAGRRRLRFDLHGVDLARIDPRRTVPDGVRLFEGAVFHGGVPAEATPFAAGSFDAVVGNFALEYTRREAALREVRRVMAAGAPARFVLHHASSVVVATALESLGHARELEQRANAFADLREYVAAERTDAALAARIHARIAERTQHLHRLAAQSRGSHLLADVLPALGRLFELRQRLAPAEFAAAVDATERGFHAAVRRLVDLVDVALDEPAMRRLAAEAADAGFDRVRFEPLRQDGELLLGWQLDLRAGPALPL